MSIGTYAQLTQALGDWSKRGTDLAAYMADFVTLGEARINRDLRLRRQVAFTTLTTVSGTQGVTLPADWLETENVTINTTPPVYLRQITPEQMDARYPAGWGTGTPQFSTIVGNTMQLGPTPDAAYPIGLDYYAKFDIATTSTNWLLTNHPGIYLAAAMAELCIYTFDDERLGLWDGKYKGEANALQDSDDTALRSGSSLRVRVL